MKGLLIKTLMLFPKIIDKIGKMNTMHQLKSMKNAFIHPSFRIGKNTFLLLSKEARITIKEGVVMKDNNAIRIRKNGELILGKNVNISDYVSINCLEKIEIGENTLFGESVKLYDHNHQYSKEKIEHKKFNTSPIKIGKNCWLGSNVIVLKGVEIGNNL